MRKAAKKRTFIPKSKELIRVENLQKVIKDLHDFKISIEQAQEKCLALGMSQQAFEDMICPSPEADYKRHQKKIEDEYAQMELERGY